MKRPHLLLAATLLSAAGVGAALAAVTSITITVSSPPSTSVTCTPVATFTGTAAVGATVCPIAVLPAGWSGSLTLSGTDAAKFSVAGSNLVVGSTALAVGTYSVTITSAP